MSLSLGGDLGGGFFTVFFSGSDFYQQGFLFGSSNVFSCVVCSVYVAFPNWTRQGVEVRVEVRPSALFKPPQTKTPSARISPRPSTLFASFTTFGQNFPWPQPPLCPRRFLRHLRPEFPLAPAPSSLPSPPSAEIFSDPTPSSPSSLPSPPSAETFPRPDPLVASFATFGQNFPSPGPLFPSFVTFGRNIPGPFHLLLRSLPQPPPKIQQIRDCSFPREPAE